MTKLNAAPEPRVCLYKTTGLHLPGDFREFLNRIAFERAMSKGSRASTPAFLEEMIERNRETLELEPGKDGALEPC